MSVHSNFPLKQKFIYPFFSRKKVLHILLIGIACIFLAMCGSYFVLKTKGFMSYKICSTLPFDARWEIPEPSFLERQSLKTLFQQRFYFLDKGAQCYVFLSENGKYVLKFFKLHSLRPPFWLKNCYFPPQLQSMRLSKILQKKNALVKTFESYKLAFEELKEETGLEYIHLNKTDYLNQKLTLIDNVGISHHLEADQMEFLVQKTAGLFYPSFIHAVEEGGIEKGKQKINDLIAFLVSRNKKGIFDKDPDLETNFGFLNDKFVQIDIGRFRKDEQRKNPDVYRDEIIRVTDDFRRYLKKNYPTLSEYLEESLNRL